MTAIQRQNIAELRAALDELEREDPELDALPGSDMTDADIDAFIARNRDEIERSVLEGRAALARGECFSLTDDNTEAFIQDIIDRANAKLAAGS